MKSLFYGGAVAAMAGLLMGAGLKTPLAAEEWGEIAVNSAFADEPLQAEYRPDYLNGAAYAPAAYQAPADLRSYTDVAAPAQLTPAAYVVEEEPAAYEAPASQPTTELAMAAPMSVTRSTDALPEAAAGFETDQGFYLLEEAPDPS